MINIKKLLLFVFLFCFYINIEAINLTENKLIVSLNSCVDGDTAKFNYKNDVIKVRFLAIDTPELEHNNQIEEPYAIDAKNYTCHELKKAKQIYLEFDSNSDIQDKYNRYLAWVFVDNELLQEKIIKKGYAKVAYLFDDYKYTSILKKEEKIAKKNKQGIWQDEKEPNYMILLIPFIIIFVLLIINICTKKNKM